ncbi:CBS domain-containing protein [Priestia filamentosa]|uniref:CBS domain-containing protein n=1 Tax=Priestia filamentosa TaxID=1402861 RepID=UPI0039834B15
MNNAFFLIPKQEVVTVNIEWTMRQALEKMEYHRYKSIPVIDQQGHYIGVLTEGDLLWKLKSEQFTFEDTPRIPLSNVPRHEKVEAISINEKVDHMFLSVMERNFVPVVDDQGIFIGIIRRREIMEFYVNRLVIEE